MGAATPSPPVDQRERFMGYLRAHGYKFTPERLAVLDQVIASRDHFTVDDLYDRLRDQSHQRVSRATIYRTLELLAESGLVNKIDWIGSTTHYEVEAEDAHHDHFICTYCGQIYEFMSPKLERIQDRVCDALGLVPEDHTLKITGIPQHCQGRMSYPTRELEPARRGKCPFGFKFDAGAAERV